MSWRPIANQEIPRSHLPFSPAARAGDFVFISGQASVDDLGNIISGTFEEEMRRSIDNLTRILVGADLTLNDVVRVTAYLADPIDLSDYNRIYQDYFVEPYPTRTTLVECLTTIRFEIDAVAYAPTR